MPETSNTGSMAALPVVSGERVYRNGFGHFTQLGHQVTAELLEEPLWEMVAGVSAGGSD